MWTRLATALLSFSAAAVAQTLTAPPPDVPSKELQLAILNTAAKNTLNYSHDLPDFTCTEEIKRYIAPAPYAVNNPAWRQGDTLLARLSFFQQREQYKLIMINSKPTNQDYRKVGGAKESGSFGTMLRDIFDPASHAVFAYDHISELGDRGMVLAFHYYVDLKHFNYELVWQDSKRHRTAYSGMVLVSWGTNRVMRVTLKAENIPEGFPIQSSETQVDYGFVDLGGRKFLLPVSAHMILGSFSSLTKNDERFTLYRKYEAESDIKFDTEPVPPEKNREVRK